VSGPFVFKANMREPRDPHGVWWWEPGASGCKTRSTGPTVLHADKAAVSPSARPEAAAVSFRLGLHSRTPSFLDVRLAIEDGRMRSLDTGGAVAVQHERPRFALGAPATETALMCYTGRSSLEAELERA